MTVNCTFLETPSKIDTSITISPDSIINCTKCKPGMMVLKGNLYICVICGAEQKK